VKHIYAKVAILLLMSTTALQAQKFRFGIHTTPTFNWINNNQPNAEAGLSVKFSYGLIAEYAFAENYSLSTGVDIMRRGGKLTVNDTVGNYSAGFVQLPIALKLRTREFGYMTYFARFGGAIGVETGETSEFEPNRLPSSELDSYINPLTASFLFGAGAEYSLGSSSAIVVGIDYHRSLFDNLVDDNPGLQDKYNYRFDYLNLTIGFLF
jgi:hypothetical protein